VLGVHISAVGMEEAVGLADSHIGQGKKGYICVTGVHGVMEAQSDPDFRQILNTATITVPDGMPTVWVGSIQGHVGMSRVYGPDFMLEICRLSASRGYTQFLYGGNPGVADQLASVLMGRFPGLRVVGSFTPPFRPLNREEEAELVHQVKTLKPDIIWIGLSTPKQEKFMAAHLAKLDTRLMIGVGAAFDIHTGKITDAPRWIKAAGLQWLHRLFQEPKRLWKRYLINNPKFIWNISMQLLHIRTFD
jgi:N-acetylglucosaminyldiphosphoundecaprenol N-acetyl-beta-D-mannosaminyltransferase